VHQFFICFFTVLKKNRQTKENAGFVDDGNICSNCKLKKEPKENAGFVDDGSICSNSKLKKNTATAILRDESWTESG
jgi:hypothetical protein